MSLVKLDDAINLKENTLITCNRVVVVKCYEKMIHKYWDGNQFCRHQKVIVYWEAKSIFCYYVLDRD